MQIPKIVKIGGHKFAVKFVEMLNKGKDAGIIDCWNDTITLAKKVKSGKKVIVKTSEAVQKITFIHEIMHAINNIFCNKQLKESDIEAISEGLYQFIVDNPNIILNKRRNKNANRKTK